MASTLGTRIIVAAIAIPLAFGAVYVGGWVLTAVVIGLGVAGVAEFLRLAAASGARPLPAIGYVGAVGMPVLAYLLVTNHGQGAAGWLLLAGFVWFIAVMAVGLVAYSPSHSAAASVAVTAFAPVYTAALPSSILFLRHATTGGPLAATAVVFFPLAMTWMCDTAAMAGGSSFGGPKFAAAISPNKTWSGAVSGLVAAAAMAGVYGSLVLERVNIQLSLSQLFTIGVTVGVLGQIGDLAESAFKRTAGVKDSGRFFPGHGGVLDRLDSLYWVLPVSALLLHRFEVL